MTIPGLPQGVECYRIARANPGEYEVIDGKVILATRQNSISQIIVRPADGWSFLTQPDGSYLPVKMLAAPKPITITAKFLVTNEYDEKRVAGLVDRLKEFGATEASLS